MPCPGVLGGALLLLLAQNRIPPQEFPLELQSKHYRLHSNAAREEGQELLDFMEMVFTTYTALLKPEEDVDKHTFKLVLYKDYRDYVLGGAPRGSGAYYSTRDRRLVGYYDDHTMRNFFAHEGMHQFTHSTCRNFQQMPFWFIEGVADCIGNCAVKEKKLYMCVKAGVIARLRLPTIQEAVRIKKYYRWRDFFDLDPREFMTNAGLCYAQAWSICHFLICYPKHEDLARQIPDGQYRKHFAAYYEILRKGASGGGAGTPTHRQAWDAAFAGTPMDKLEEQWKDYILKMDTGKFLGFDGHELKDEEADALKLGEKHSGLRVAAVVPDSVGAKAGLTAGDILIRFDGRRLPRGSALDRLKLYLQEIPFGRAAKITVLRNGAEVELKAVWEKKS